MNKKIVLIIGIIIVLIFGIILITSCSKEEVENEISISDKNNDKDEETYGTKDISYHYDSFVVNITVPTKINDGDENALYKFQKEAPKDKGYCKGNFYLVGDKLLLGFGTIKYFHQNEQAFIEKYGEKDPTFEDFLNYINSSDYKGAYKNVERIKIGDREGARIEIRVGTEENNLKGYRYIFNADDILDDSFIEMYVTPKNKNGNIEELLVDDEVKSMLDSIDFFN